MGMIGSKWMSRLFIIMRKNYSKFLSKEEKSQMKKSQKEIVENISKLRMTSLIDNLGNTQ
jgi:hypothetical protein